MSDQHDWELSKENVQPLREGRQMDSLTASLSSDKKTEKDIKAKQNEFELELRTNTEIDSFDIWDRYIRWSEQHFPKGGHDGHLMALIQRCLKEFQHNELYKSDPRFIRVWIKFANSSEEPWEVFSHMFDNGIGQNVANLYTEWALILERHGDTKKADAIYTEGINRNAQPKVTLLQMHKQFQQRLAHNITLQIAEGHTPSMDTVTTVEENRLVLGRLKTSGQARKVGTQRTGAVVKGPAGSFKSSAPGSQTQVPGGKIQIFCDENAPSLQPQQTNEWKSLPTRADLNRENEKKPGVWAGAKVKQKKAAPAPIASSLSFQIHEDEDDGQPQETPRKTALFNTQPLSSRKPAKYVAPLDNLRAVQGVPNLNDGRPMYDKPMVYNGTMEFSFEELRAARYWKMRARKQEAEEREAEKRRADEMQKQLLAMTEKMARMEALLQNQNQSSEPSQSSIDTSNPDSSNTNPSLMGHSSRAHMNHQSTSFTNNNNNNNNNNNSINPNASLNPGANSTNNNSSQRTPIFNSSSLSTASSVGISHTQANMSSSQRTPIFNNTSSLSAHSEGSSANMSSRGLQAQQAFISRTAASDTSSSRVNTSGFGHTSQSNTSHNHSLSTSLADQSRLNRTTTPKSKSITPDTTGSFSKRGMLSGPSPTVCTKEAMLEVQNMFYGSFENTTHTEELASFDTSEAVPPSRGAMPFQICEDRTAQLLLEADGAVGGAGVQVYQDEAPAMESLSSMPSARKGLGFQVFSDTPAAGPGTAIKAPGFQVFMDDQENQGTARKTPGFQIHSDIFQAPPAPNNERPRPPSITNTERQRKFGVQIPSDKVTHGLSSARHRGGLQIHQDTMDTQESLKQDSAHKGARRGLGFMTATSTDNVDMAGAEGEFTMNLNNDFTIECQAQQDVTLAGLDRFSVHAQAASTPAPAHSAGMRRTPLDNMTEDSSSAACTTAGATTFGEPYCTAKTQDLSPILEGSGEGSDESKSTTAHSSTSGTLVDRSRHASTRSMHDHVEPIAEDREEQEEQAGDSSMLDAENLDATMGHLIDTSTYAPPAQPQDQADFLSQSIMVNPHNPFDEETIAGFLRSMDPPLESYPNFHFLPEPAPAVQENGILCIGDRYVSIEKQLGQGGYAKVYMAMEHSMELDLDMDTTNYTSETQQTSVLKVQSPPCLWEFYISSELHRRLARLASPVDVRPSVMSVINGYIFPDVSFLELQYLGNGSLLDFVNKYKTSRSLLADVEAFACLLAVELLAMFTAVHGCQIIHGDVKPDNFLMRNLPCLPEGVSRHEVFPSSTSLVSLIDFGQSIDLTKFPEGTTFTASVKTSGFQCIEMRTNQPWTFQTDLFGLAGTIHVVLFGAYMNVYQEDGVWRHTGTCNRKWNRSLWSEFFTSMLNVASCAEMPDLAALKCKFENYFLTQVECYNTWVQSVKSLSK